MHFHRFESIVKIEVRTDFVACHAWNVARLEALAVQMEMNENVPRSMRAFHLDPWNKYHRDG